METIKDKAYFKGLANRLMFDLSDEEALDIVKEFKTLCSQLELLEAIDTTGVESINASLATIGCDSIAEVITIASAANR